MAAGSYGVFGSTSSVSQASLSSQAPYMPIFPIPYTMFDPNFGMTGSYASNAYINGTIITCQLCRKIGHGARTCRILSSFGKGSYNGGNGFARNTGGNGNGNPITCQLCKLSGHGAKTCGILSFFGKGSYTGGNGFARNTGGNGNGNTITCQLCKLSGHGAKTCGILSSFGNGIYNGGNGGIARNTGSNGHSNTITCQLCKQIGHGAKTCSTISTFQQGNTLIGFPNQQRENLIGDAPALLTARYKGSIQDKNSSCQSLVHTPILPHLTTAHLPPLFILSSTSAPNLEISAKLDKRQYDQLHDKFLNLQLENDAIQLLNQELTNKVVELQKSQESVMVQLSVECHIARERIQELESEVVALVSEKIETEKLVSELELQIDSLSESSRSYENTMQDLLLKISVLETANKDIAKKLQLDIWKKAEQINDLLMEVETHEQHVALMDKQVSQLHITLEQKEQLIQQYKEQEKTLEEHITESQTLLTAAETRIVEDKKKYDLMLESKQLELSRHLKDISQRHDRAITDTQKKYEVEKLEIVNMEKQKAEKLIGETEGDDLFLFHRPKKKNLELQSGVSVFKDSGTTVSTYDATHFGSLLTRAYNPSIVISAPA